MFEGAARVQVTDRSQTIHRSLVIKMNEILIQPGTCSNNWPEKYRMVKLSHSQTKCSKVLVKLLNCGGRCVKRTQKAFELTKTTGKRMGSVHPEQLGAVLKDTQKRIGFPKISSVRTRNISSCT